METTCTLWRKHETWYEYSSETSVIRERVSKAMLCHLCVRYINDGVVEIYIYTCNGNKWITTCKKQHSSSWNKSQKYIQKEQSCIPYSKWNQVTKVNCFMYWSLEMWHCLMVNIEYYNACYMCVCWVCVLCLLFIVIWP